MEYLVLHRWPGNVQQLAKAIRRMAALAETRRCADARAPVGGDCRGAPDDSAPLRTRARCEGGCRVPGSRRVALAIGHIERAMIGSALTRPAAA